MDHHDPILPEDPDLGMQDFEHGAPIEADAGAMDAAGLSDPKTASLDRILRETREELGQEELPQPAQTPVGDQEYRDSDPEEKPQGGEQAMPARRIRRKKMKSRGAGLLGLPHFVCTLVLIGMILAVGFTLAMTAWTCADDLMALTKPDQEVSVTIQESDSMEQITKKLVDAGLVRYDWLFNAYAKLSHARQKISNGTFTLNAMYDYHAIVNALGRSSSNREELLVMIPEGYTCRQIFELLEKKGICTAKELEEASMSGDLGEYWFLEGVKRDGKYCLEGYLFPDTYYFYTDDNPARVLRKLLNNFENKFDDTMQGYLSKLNDSFAEKLRSFDYDDATIARRKFTVRDIVIIASMIEKESAGAGESDVIASVIYNRLADPDFLYLNIDATVQYALPEHKDVLSSADLEIDSPYNTYKVIGLPVGPISNPGYSSLRAALVPEETDYYYYALDTDGTHHFSRTLEEHNAFLNGLGENEENDGY